MANIPNLLGEAYHEGMTNDEIVEALKNVSLPQDRSAELESLKKAYDKAASETADYKRQLKARMSEEEKRIAEETERYKKMEEENASLKKKFALSDLTTKFVASGLDAETAMKTAEAALGGDFDTVVASYTARIESATKTAKEEAKAEMLAENPVMRGGRGGGTPQVKDYSEEIASSWATGDYVSVAALVRQQNEQNMNND